MKEFEDGFSYISRLTGSLAGAKLAEGYIENVNQAILDFENSLQQYAGNQLSDERLAGFIAEHWHAGTFNIKAAIEGSSAKATVEGLNTLGSVDISTSWGHNYGAKYLNNAAHTGHAQSVSFWERYCKYKAQAEKNGNQVLDFEGFLRAKGIQRNPEPHSSIYLGQYRLIPKEQLEGVREYLKKKIEQTSATRPELAEKYKETLRMLTDRISDNKGTESIPLSTDDAITLAKMARESGIDLKKLGISLKELIQPRHIIQQAMKVGMTSAVITMVLQTAPEIYKLLSILVHRGELDILQLKNTGNIALSSSAEGFLRGGITAALVTSIQAEKFGIALKNVNPAVIGAIVALTLEIFKKSIALANGRMTKGEFFDDILRGIFVSGFSIAGGVILGSIPCLNIYGYLLGNFLGGIVGTFAYKACNHIYMALCVENGWTLFGIVEQNYKLPNDTLKELGINVFEFEKITYDSLEYKNICIKKFQYDEFVPDTIDIKILRRGVVGIHEIAYV